VDRLAALLSIDLATLPDEQLVAHREAVHAAAVDGREAGNLNTDSLSLLRAAVDVVRQVDEEIDSRNVGAAALAEEADAALSELTVAASRRPPMNRFRCKFWPVAVAERCSAALVQVNSGTPPGTRTRNLQIKSLML
jgi:hypothetical protein